MGQLAKGKTLNHFNPIAQVRPWHRAMARYVAAGMRPGELCLVTGYSHSHVTTILASPLFQAEVARIESQAEVSAVSVKEDLKLMSVRAIEVLDEALDTTVDNWGDRAKRIDAAFGVLDRAGYGKKDQPSDPSLHLHLHKEVKAMSDEELLRNVLDVVKEGEDS